jgi:hypothetical protein
LASYRYSGLGLPHDLAGELDFQPHELIFGSQKIGPARF